YITSIDLRRVWIVDEEKGLVFGLTMFRQPMESKSVTILNKDGTTEERPMNFNPFDLEAYLQNLRRGTVRDRHHRGFVAAEFEERMESVYAVKGARCAWRFIRSRAAGRTTTLALGFLRFDASGTLL